MKTLKLAVPGPLASALRTHFGEVNAESVLAAVDYACRRKLALAKDSKRFEAGKLARRIYTPRLPENAPKSLAQAVSRVADVADRLAERLAKNGGKRS